MSKGILVGEDNRSRRNLLTYFRGQDLPCEACATLAELPALLDKDAGVRFVLLLADLRIPHVQVQALADQYRGRVRLLVEIEDDTAEIALSYVLDYGIYYVYPRGTMRLPKLSQILHEAVGGNLIPNFKRLVKENVTSLSTSQRQAWGFMSMNWHETHPDGSDYSSGVFPAMKRLGVSLQRMDAFYVDQQGIRRNIEEGIRSRAVVVAMLSPYQGHVAPGNDQPPSPNVMYEVATAYAVGNRVILLYRESGRNALSANTMVPAVLRGEDHLAYSSKCELALRLFFGLGGTGFVPRTP